jgi:hypothetical protein
MYYVFISQNVYANKNGQIFLIIRCTISSEPEPGLGLSDGDDAVWTPVAAHVCLHVTASITSPSSLVRP